MKRYRHCFSLKQKTTILHAAAKSIILSNAPAHVHLHDRAYLRQIYPLTYLSLLCHTLILMPQYILLHIIAIILSFTNHDSKPVINFILPPHCSSFCSAKHKRPLLLPGYLLHQKSPVTILLYNPIHCCQPAQASS